MRLQRKEKIKKSEEEEDWKVFGGRGNRGVTEGWVLRKVFYAAFPRKAGNLPVKWHLRGFAASFLSSSSGAGVLLRPLPPSFGNWM